MYNLFLFEHTILLLIVIYTGADTMFFKTYELCPFCEYEVELEPIKYTKQKCPICGELISACSLCNPEEMKCNECISS